MSKKRLFGFGSLISPESLRATAPNATDIRLAYIKGFKRSFSLWDPIGYTETNLDLAGNPFTALDLHKVSDTELRVNGVIFSVDNEDYQRLLVREQEYDLLETVAYDYFSDKLLGKCGVFSANKNNASYDFGSATQKRYLDIYLQAAKLHGQAFYEEVLDTTFIGEQNLNHFPELIN